MSEFSLSAKLAERNIELESMSDGMCAAFVTACGSIAQGAMNEWVRLAQTRLRTSREDYINGLRQSESFKMREEGDNVVFEMSLVGEMANNFEFGMASFDMKSVRPGWLGGGKAKTSKDGTPYVTIPFRHSTSSDSAMRYTGKAAFADPDLKSQLRSVVKEYGLDRMVRVGNNVKEGAVASYPGGGGYHRYLSGLTRYQKGIDSHTQNGRQRGYGQLMTFRRLSAKSKPESWIHPGLNGAHILPEVEGWLDTQLDNAIELILGGN